MDNQQERFELAWLAGFIEGEGWFSLCRVKVQQKNNKKTITYTPNVGACNSDVELMEHFMMILSKYGIRYRQQTRNKNGDKECLGYSCRKPIIEVSIATQESLKIFLPLIRPYLHSVKRHRADLLLEYIKIRQSKPRSGPRARHGKEEDQIYEKLYSYKGKSQFKNPQRLNAESVSNQNTKIKSEPIGNIGREG